MGKTTKWLKSLLGMKKPNDKTKTNENMLLKHNNNNNNNNNKNPTMNSNKWFKRYIVNEEDEQNKHAIAVAAATAAAADAAVVAAQAAVAVVRLTSYGRKGFGFVGVKDLMFFSAVKIQAFFRGYLARRAHRALKGLVKLQALVRGYLVRKRAAATLYSMQALIRAQATVRSHRANHALNKDSKSQSEFQPRRSVERFDETKNVQLHSKRLSTSYEPYNPHEGSPKIVEIDTFRPRTGSRRINNPSMYDYGGDECQYPTISSPLPYPVPSKLTMGHHGVYDWSVYADECRISTAQSTPRFTNSKRSNGPPTPSKSVCGDGFFRTNFNHPSYMANTQSFRAKLRSQSAPKHRPESRSKKGLSLDEVMAGRNSISGLRMQRSSSQVHEGLNF